jgi:hypothetical protein
LSAIEPEKDPSVKFRCVVLCSVALLTACSSGGTPEPEAAAPPAPSQAGVPDGFPTANLRGAEACGILEKALQGQSYEPVVDGTIGGIGGNSCTADAATTMVSLVMQADAGIGDIDGLPGKNPRQDKINGRSVVEIRETGDEPGDCVIIMDTGAHARASVTAIVSGTTDEACATANDVARRVEPFLPKVS